MGNARAGITAGNTLVLLIAAVCGFFAWFPITNTDIWWHLASAREMLRQGALLTRDPFTYTESIGPWINIHWLFQLFAYGVYSLGGGAALVLLKIAVFSASVFILMRAFRLDRSPYAAALVIPVMMYIPRYEVLARPIIITLLFTACFFYCLERYASTRRVIWLALLVPVQILWCNTQGLFILGIYIASVYGFDLLLKRKKGAPAAARLKESLQLGLLPALLFGACILSPGGWRTLVYPFRLFSRISPEFKNIFSANVSENASMIMLWTGGERLLTVSVILTALAGLLLILTRERNLRLRHLLLFLPFLVLAIMARRNILLFFFIAGPLISRLIPEQKGSSEGADTRWSIPIIPVSAACILLLIFFHARVVRLYPEHSAFSPFRYPDAAVRYLKANPVEGNIFNSIRYGGYLDWALFPEKKCYIDGRLVIRTPAFFAEYLSVLDHPDRFEGLAHKRDITHVLIPVALFDRYFNLGHWLYIHPQWKLAYTDGASALFVNETQHPQSGIDLSDPLEISAISGEINQRWADDPSIRYESIAYFAMFLNRIGEEASAELVRRKSY